MSRATLIIATVLVFTTLAVQALLTTSPRWQTAFHSANLGDGNIAEWSMDKLPDSNATDHLVFETVYSLLQRWPNTRMRNGHNIVPGTVPTGTLLYHGTVHNEVPPGPDWVATDPEHSYTYCRDPYNRVQAGCWHATLATTRPLKVIYFDGSSAAKFPGGSMDSQDLIVWGTSSEDRVFDEKGRIKCLCEWGKKFGLDGIVRMSMDFEIMLCNFTSGIRVVSFANLVSQWARGPLESVFIPFETISAGSWHNHFPGESRIQLDLAGLVSFYDTHLAPSLVGIRAGQERWDHRVRDISSEDLSVLKSRLEANLFRPEGSSSRVDWKTLIQVLVDRYAQRFELVRYLLNSSGVDRDEILGLANKTQSQLRIMLTPYLLFSATPTEQSDKAGLEWAVPVYKHCATTHTYFMESELDSMTDSEKLLLQAVQGTSREICRVVTKMWAAGVYAGIDPLLNTKEYPDFAEINRLWATWREDLSRLMTWLDWGVWVKCNPSCDFEEICYLPTWPFGFPVPWKNGIPESHFRTGHGGPLYPGTLTSSDFRSMVLESLVAEMWSIVKPEPDDWIRPRPKCIRPMNLYVH